MMINFQKKDLDIFVEGYIMVTLGDKKGQKKGTESFVCEVCDFECSKKYSWDRHLLTAKHAMVTFGDKKGKKGQKKGTSICDGYACDVCGKVYRHRQGLWRHKKTCGCGGCDANESDQQEPSDKQLVMMLIKENTDFKTMMFRLLENGTHNTTNHITNTTHTNSHNKAFNLNFFLNETCKHAMNITDFVDSIKLQLSDFINVGEVGFIEGISNIIVQNLNSLDETVRPIHCTDQKRETFYVKDENIWEREDEDKKKLKQLVKSVAFKNEKLMKTYKDTYPDYDNPESNRSDQYSKTVIEALDSKEENTFKIIKNISKATTIKKPSCVNT